MHKTLKTFILGITASVMLAGTAFAQGFEMPEMPAPDGIVQLQAAEQAYLTAQSALADAHADLQVTHDANESATAAVVVAIADDAGDNEALMTAARAARSERAAKQQAYDDALLQHTNTLSALAAIRTAQADPSVSDAMDALVGRVDALESTEPEPIEEDGADVATDVAAMKALLETLCGRLKEGIYAANCTAVMKNAVSMNGSTPPVDTPNFTFPITE